MPFQVLERLAQNSNDPPPADLRLDEWDPYTSADYADLAHVRHGAAVRDAATYFRRSYIFSSFVSSS